MIEQGKTIAVVDQFSKYVETVKRRGWHSIGSDPTIEIKQPWEKVTVLGAVTHEGDSFYTWTDENLSADHGIRLLGALVEEFGDGLVVFLDRAQYFYAKDLWEFVSGNRETETVGDSMVSCVRGDTLDVWYFPPRLPKFNPVEQCWDQVKEWFNYRLIDDLEELEQALLDALAEINEPGIWNYLCL